MSPSTTSDKAYETMFNDDELLGNNQVMPWFNPNYTASDDNVSHMYNYVKSGNKNQLLGTHIGLEINTLKFS